jgi:ABC-type antimicrobial peptide transport system permease subunit
VPPRTLFVAGLQREPEQPSRYNFLVRTRAGDPANLLPGLDGALRDADPGLRVRATLPYGTLIDRSMPAERILGTLGAVFGLLALLVAGVGLFGLLAFQVARRTNELGVRLALGATRGAIVGLILRDAAWMVVAGVALGSAGAWLVTGYARSVLFELTPTDPRAFGTAAVVLAGTALVAAWLPARRASHVDPLEALRQE